MRLGKCKRVLKILARHGKLVFLACQDGVGSQHFPAHGKVFDPARAMWWAYLEPVEDGNELVVLDYHEMD